MSPRILRPLALSLLLLSLTHGEARSQTAVGAEPARYRIEIPSPDPASLRVSAEIPYADGRVFVDSIQAQHLPRSWATFVRVVGQEGD